MPSSEIEGRHEFEDSGRDSPTPEMVVPSRSSLPLYMISAVIIYQEEVRVGRWRRPALPNAKRSGIKPLLKNGFKCMPGVVMIRSVKTVKSTHLVATR